MKKLISFISISLCLNLTSCIYTDDTYVPQPPNYYYGLSIDVFSYEQVGNFIDINFSYPYVSGRDYFWLLIEDPTGNLVVGGRRWVKVTDDSWYSPVTLYVDGLYIQPFRTYRCMVMSSWGNYSQQFFINVY